MTILRFAYATPCLYPAQDYAAIDLPAGVDDTLPAENYFAIDPVLRPENFSVAICRGMTDSFVIRRNCGMVHEIMG